MDGIFVKIKKAREKLKLTQVAIADLSGVSQRNVSDMENGVKKFIPNNYITFLHINGIDINSIFDDSFEPRFRPKEDNTPMRKSILNSDLLELIRDKDRKLLEQSELIGKLKQENTQLRHNKGYNLAAEP